MKNNNSITAVIMLVAGGIVTIGSIIMKIELQTTLWLLLCTLVVFGITGAIVQSIVRRINVSAEERLRLEAEQQRDEEARLQAEQQAEEIAMLREESEDNGERE